MCFLVFKFFLLNENMLIWLVIWESLLLKKNCHQVSETSRSIECIFDDAYFRRIETSSYDKFCEKLSNKKIHSKKVFAADSYCFASYGDVNKQTRWTVGILLIDEHVHAYLAAFFALWTTYFNCWVRDFSSCWQLN